MSNDYRLEEANDAYVEACADEIATRSAKLVAAGVKGEADAIQSVTEDMRQEMAADDDVTGVLATMLNPAIPDKVIPEKQVYAIKMKLMDAAREAAETLR